MTPEQALDLLNQVAAIYRGTRREHEQLITALETLKALIPKPAPKDQG